MLWSPAARRLRTRLLISFLANLHTFHVHTLAELFTARFPTLLEFIDFNRQATCFHQLTGSLHFTQEGYSETVMMGLIHCRPNLYRDHVKRILRECSPISSWQKLYMQGSRWQQDDSIPQWLARGFAQLKTLHCKCLTCSWPKVQEPCHISYRYMRLGHSALNTDVGN